MIDPKINLRIVPDTNLDLLVLATELTRKGLGFPQYSNDAVVIPGLVAHGYELEDARDYTVAACWEFIIPGKGMDVVNFGAVYFPVAVDKGIRLGLAAKEDFEGVLERVSGEIRRQVDEITDRWTRLLLPPAPYYSALMDDCLERGRDISKGAKYNNIGIHGACCTSAADALAGVRRFVFKEQTVKPHELLAALDSDYEGWESLRCMLAEDGPRVGNNDDDADEMMTKLFDLFANACESSRNQTRRGFIRPGTGSASLYLGIKSFLGASAEGRRKGEAFSANLSPAPGARVRGPISVLQSFGKIDYSRVCNGGPITMEMSDTVFRDVESVRKVAMLVRTFAQIGCQQLQLNALSYEKLLEAKAHPEKHRDLIVRVWGWSGYFCELAPEYQDHVIRRYQYSVV
jgi:formate C-acetyltransferase